MAGIPSRKARFGDRIKRFFLTGKTLKGILWAALFLAVLVIINQTILPRIGYKLRIDSEGFRLRQYIYYSRNESKILNILINNTPTLGKIPQEENIRSKTGSTASDYKECIESLAEKGDILLDKSGEIIRAYPWADTGGFHLYLIVNQDSTIGPIGAAGAFHAMSVAPLLGVDTRIEAKLKDTGEPLAIEIENSRIAYTNSISAVVYRTENYENSAFYSSPEGIEADYAGQYDINKVIRLDRALAIGKIIAREIKDKINR
jgi:hypothetical protein